MVWYAPGEPERDRNYRMAVETAARRGVTLSAVRDATGGLWTATAIRPGQEPVTAPGVTAGAAAWAALHALAQPPDEA